MIPLVQTDDTYCDFRFHGVIYLSIKYSEEALEEFLNMDDEDAKWSSLGHKFEQYLTEGKLNSFLFKDLNDLFNHSRDM